MALLTACQAMHEGDICAAASALLDAARCARGNGDLFADADLAAEVSRLARRAGLSELAATADSLNP